MLFPPQSPGCRAQFDPKRRMARATKLLKFPGAGPPLPFGERASASGLALVSAPGKPPA
jgi:hypothetical protein